MKIHDKTLSLCNICSSEISADLVEENNKLYLVKSCESTKDCLKEGEQRVMISNNAESYLVIAGQPACTEKYGMSIIEIIQSCNIKCTTCIADSAPGKDGILELSDIDELLEKIKNHDVVPDTIVISGGEPTVHPKFREIVDIVSKSGFSHTVVISNGVDISGDESIAEFLSSYNGNVEVYLQFDSLTPFVLEELRGEDLSAVRLNALHNLNKYGIPTTLVCVVKRGLNEHELFSTISYGSSIPCVKGITFQPIRDTGRHFRFSQENSISLSEVCCILEDGNEEYINGIKLRAHHYNPKHIQYCYLDRKNQMDDTLKDNIDNYLIDNARFFMTKNDSLFGFSYENSLRIMVVEYMDKFNFNKKDLEYNSVGVVNENGLTIPIEKHYMRESNSNNNDDMLINVTNV